MRRLFDPRLLLLLLLVACTERWPELDPRAPLDRPGADGAAPLAPIAADAGIYTPIDCPFTVRTDREVDCGVLTVPENRAQPDSRNIQLAVATLRAARPAAAPDPIIYLAGGPGDSALVDFAFDVTGWTDLAFTTTRDVIFLDQRGTGFSWPSLDCPEFDAVRFDGERRCYDRLRREGVDLTAYNSIESAADVADLMRALGIPEYNLLGVSYGTRLALTLMRDHPGGIRAAVLDSPFPPNARTPQEEAIVIWRAIQALFADCAADPACADRYPDLEAMLIDAVIDLNEEPLGDLIGDDILGVIEDMLFAADEYAYLVPRLIEDVYYGDYELFEELALELLGFGASRRQAVEDEDGAEGVFNSITCREEFAFASLAEAEAEIAAAIPEPLQAGLGLSVFQLYGVCDYWASGRAPAVENEAVASDIPTLILVGEYDPVTPPAWAQLTAATLTRGDVYEFPGAGHSLLSTSDCAAALATAFLQAPTTPPDRSCLATLGEVAFEW